MLIGVRSVWKTLGAYHRRASDRRRANSIRSEGAELELPESMAHGFSICWIDVTGTCFLTSLLAESSQLVSVFHSHRGCDRGVER